MKRREFIRLLGGAVAAWPYAARAQQSDVPLVGFLHQGSAGSTGKVVDAFLRGLQDADTRIDATYNSNSVGPTDTTTGWVRWRPIWFGSDPR
jgi:hypothetical protein